MENSSKLQVELLLVQNSENYVEKLQIEWILM